MNRSFIECPIRRDLFDRRSVHLERERARLPPRVQSQRAPTREGNRRCGVSVVHLIGEYSLQSAAWASAQPAPAVVGAGAASTCAQLACWVRWELSEHPASASIRPRRVWPSRTAIALKWLGCREPSQDSPDYALGDAVREPTHRVIDSKRPHWLFFAGTMIAAGFRALIEVRTAEATETRTSGVGASCSARDLNGAWRSRHGMSWAHTSNREGA